ncbi:MAG: winged helix-turn-helix transcriptional regulator [Lachnospiraceae bacterium]|nr:winged helix-turn-helix transcriptional regulator [Lachnospiraceae bacterium]
MNNTKETIEDDTMYELSELFKVFADLTRVKLMYALFDGELCVQDIAEKLDMTQSAISHQLRVLKTAKLVKGRRNGKQIYYSLADDHVKTILGQGIEHVTEED